MHLTSFARYLERKELLCQIIELLHGPENCTRRGFTPDMHDTVGTDKVTSQQQVQVKRPFLVEENNHGFDQLCDFGRCYIGCRTIF